MLSTIKHKLISLFQLILVIIYIIFEELIWEGIAHPIYTFVHSLKILQKVERRLHDFNRYVILILFIVMLAGVEALGLYAGYLFVSGQVAVGLSIYLTKIPIAAFTFWMFRITEDKLMKFVWFKWIYDYIMRVINWLKSSHIYISMMLKIKELKEKIKLFKQKYFSKESPFVSKIKHFYSTIKTAIGKKVDD